jgi:hypothetical protein
MTWDFDALDTVLAAIVLIFVVLAAVMLYAGNTTNIGTVLDLLGSFVLLLTGKQIPSATTTSLVKQVLATPVVDNSPKLS